MMALLTPLNVNCHASDGRKVLALIDFISSGNGNGEVETFKELWLCFLYRLIL